MDKEQEALFQGHKRLMLMSYRFYVSEMFSQIHKTKFVFGPHHEKIITALEKVLRGETRKLIINIAPRYSKTEIAVKMFISKGLAVNPRSRFLHLSYSASLAADNSLAIKNIVANEYYDHLFHVGFGPKSTQMWWQTMEGGGVYATSTLGQITGFGAGLTESEEELLDEYTAEYNKDRFSGAIVIDDPIKPEDALSDNARESVNRRFETTIRNRVNSRKTPIIIIMQRLHEHDLCGYLQEAEPGEWEVLKIPAISRDENGNEVALWPFKHTLEELHSLRKINPWVFDTQYMQEPKPLEGLLFPEGETVYFREIPTEPEMTFIQVDPADEGKDCYCSKVFMVKDGYAYNVDTIYTEDKLEITLPRQKEQILRWRPSYVNIESVSAWRLVAKDIKEWAAEVIPDTEIRRFNVHANKEVRIFNEAPTIRNRFRYRHPEMQNAEYAKCMKEKHSYLKMGKNQRDDGVDCDAAASHWMKRNSLISVV